MKEIITSDDEVKVTVESLEVAHFEGADLVAGHISEGNKPLAEGGGMVRMGAPELIALAQWLLARAEERARDEEQRKRREWFLILKGGFVVAVVNKRDEVYRAGWNKSGRVVRVREVLRG